jgi:hypothetical protein
MPRGPRAGDPSQSALLPGALLLLLFLKKKSEPCLVLRIDVRRWRRESINWRVEDTPRSLKLLKGVSFFNSFSLSPGCRLVSRYLICTFIWKMGSTFGKFCVICCHSCTSIRFHN